MNKIKGALLLVFTYSCFFSNLYAVIDADVSIATYYQDENPFVEVSLHIVGETLEKKKLANGEVETRSNILIKVIQGNEIVDFAKYGLISPSAINAADYIDLKRFTLQPGEYILDIQIADQLDLQNIFEEKIRFVVTPFTEEIRLSQISLMHQVNASEQVDNPFYKYGNILEPAAFQFFHRSMNTLFVFAELYNADLWMDEKFAIKFSIISADDNEEKLVKYKKYEPKNKLVILEGIPIVDLLSGNYILSLELLTKSNESLLVKQVFFQRSNPEKDNEFFSNPDFDLSNSFVGNLNEEELRYNLIALSPRLHQQEQVTVNMLLQDENIKGQRFYLYNYWSLYDPVKPEETFKQYWQIAKAVDKKFYNTVGYGFQTDRGYIFLKYGKPDNMIHVENEPSAPPYEIWFYDKLDITGETNMKFLFYNPSLGGYDFELLHSTSRYEKQNRQWEVVLYSDDPNSMIGNPIDATTVQDNINRRAREYFNDNN